MTIPKIAEINITKFEVIKNNQKLVSKLLEKEKAKEKYCDTITTGNSGLISYNEDDKIKVCLGNISSGEEIELKTYFFGHVISKDLSYQAKFPVIFPDFNLDRANKNENKVIDDQDTFLYYFNVLNQEIKGKIYIKTRSKITRLVISGSKNFTKIEKRFEKDKMSAEIDIYKDHFNSKDIPGIVLFRTEKINDDALYYQCDPRKKKSYYLLQKTLVVPKFINKLKDEIDEDEKINYASLVKDEDNENINDKKEKECFIFLLDQSGSMEGNSIDLSCQALLLFLQSLDTDCYFQLIGFGSSFEFYSKKPLEYTKKNITNLMTTIKGLSADKGGTNIFDPLQKIYKDKMYDDYDMIKNIIILTDGEVDNKEKVLNLIVSNSSRFILHSIGIGACDIDLIERAALVGNGYSIYINNLNSLNSNIISLLEKTRKSIRISCKTNKKCFVENNTNKIVLKNQFFNHGFILDNISIEDIEIKIKKGNKEDTLIFEKNKIIKLPDGDNLGKLIVDSYLKSSICKNSSTRINLSKEFNVLTSETAFYAKIKNDVPVQDNMIKITNKDQPIKNNIDQKPPQQEVDLSYDDPHFGYIEEEEIVEPKNQGLFKGILSKFFGKDNNIIKRTEFKYKEKKSFFNKKSIITRATAEPLDLGCANEDRGIDMDYDNYYNIENNEVDADNKKEEKEVQSALKFNELIFGQDIIEGNWKMDEQVDILLKEEKDLYEKIKNYGEKKNIKDENGLITLFIIYYISKKRKEKEEELKFVINKAKNFVKKILLKN